MRFLLLFVFLITAYFAEGQNVDSVSKIIFQYAKGHNSWGKPEIYDKKEIIEFDKLIGDNFKISKYQIITRTERGDGSKSISDTSDLTVDGFRIIPKTQIEKLFIALNTPKDNFDISFIRPRLITPQRRIIIKIAKSDTNDYGKLLDRDYLEKAEKRAAIKRMRHFDKLDKFILLNKPDPDAMSVMSDAWNNMRIYCINKNDTSKFDSQLFKLMGQPIDKFKKGTYDLDKGIVNLEINTIIADLLPQSSFLKQNIAIDALTEEYIKWYLGSQL